MSILLKVVAGLLSGGMVGVLDFRLLAAHRARRRQPRGRRWSGRCS